MNKKSLIIKLVGLTSLLVIVAGVVGAKPVSAALTLRQDPGGSIPAGIRGYLINCDQGTRSPGFEQWISPAGNPSSMVVTSVPYGASSVDLTYHFNGAVCKPNSDVGYTNVRVMGASIVDGNGNPAPGSVSGIVGQQLGLDFRPDYRGVTGAYRQADTPTFQFNAPPGGFTSSGVYRVRLATRVINHFESNNVSQCVTSSGTYYAANPTDFNACPDGFPTLAVFIEVQPKPVQDPVGYVEADCNEIRGWSHNNDAQYNPTSVHIYIDGKFIGARTANQTNRQNSSWTDWYYMNYPTEYRDARPHTVRVYAISPPGGTNPLIGSRDVPSCVKSSVEASDCNSVHGWVYNSMNPGKSYDVDVYINGPSGTGRKVGRFPANLDSPDVGVAGKHRFSVPKSVLDGYKDAFTHPLFVYLIDQDEGGVNPYLGSTTIGPCGLPTCGNFNATGGSPEAGVSFTARANYVYSDTGSYGRALRYDMGLDINGVRNVTGSGWSIEGDANFDGTPIPPGANRTNTVESTPMTINNPGSISAVWQVQWVIPADSTIVNTLYDAYRAAGGNSPYPGESTGFYQSPDFSMNKGSMLGVWKTSPNGAWYGLLNCKGSSGVIAKPYVKVFGNDVAAGGKFANGNTDCDGSDPPSSSRNAGTGLWAFAKRVVNGGNSYYGGASTQFATVSLGDNAGFSSAAQRNPENASLTAPNPAVGLSFGNMVDGQNLVSDYGGNSPIWRCIPDYFSARDAANTSGPNVPTGPKSGQTAVFVDGDAYIRGNIFYASTGGWATLNDIPNYYLIVKGDIYIDHSVSALDGTYIAQPRTATTGGHIYTCTNSSSLYEKEALYDNCRTKLTVTGSFIAKQVWYQRTNGTVNSSIPDASAAPNQLSLAWSSAGQSAGQCMNTLESGSPSWNDNFLCTSRSDLYWTWLPGISPNAGFKHNAGDQCFGWASRHGNDLIWQDNQICWPNGAPNPQFSWSNNNDGSKSCTQITGIADPGWQSNSWLCVPKVAPPAYPAVGQTTLEGPGSNNIAEVFNFSQESYLAPTPAVLESVIGVTGRGNNKPYNAITSLPPIL